MQTVVGLYDNATDVQRVLDALHGAGIPNEQISVITRDPGHRSAVQVKDGGGDATGAMALGGAALGGISGLLAGLGALGALAIPGIGPIIAVGTLGGALAGTAIGAGVGAAAGSLIGALADAGIPQEEANIYAEGVRRGSILVSVNSADHFIEKVRQIMRQTGAVNIEDRRRQWQSEGWTSFDPQAQPYDSEWEQSSKVGTGVGAASGAATGATIGMAGGPAGAVVGGLAGAATGAAVGAAGDTAGESMDDDTVGNDHSDSARRL